MRNTKESATLGHDYKVAEVGSTGEARGSAGAAEDVHQLGLGGTPGWSDAEDGRRGEAGERRISENEAVDANVFETGQVGGSEKTQFANACPCKAEAEDGAHGREQ